VRYGVAVGRAVAVMAVHDSGWRDALAMKAAGVGVVAVIDLRSDVAPDLSRRRARRGLPCTSAMPSPAFPGAMG
jgi:regulator of RNase E activity RraA